MSDKLVATTSLFLGSTLITQLPSRGFANSLVVGATIFRP